MITILEFKRAISTAKNNKTSGFDSIPVEVLKRDTVISCLHVLFNVCYRTEKIPYDWGKGIMNAIPKSSANDPQDPLSYRGITLAPCIYKLYCSVLNSRLSTWVENNDKLVVVPCGGRKTSPRTSTIVQFIFYFGPLRSAIIF